jgi:hypothetical protein
VPERKVLYSLSRWGRVRVGFNNIRRLSFHPHPLPKGGEFSFRHYLDKSNNIEETGTPLRFEE